MKKVELLDFLAPWCTHCHNMTPSIDFLIEQYKDDENVLIRKIDVDVNPEIAKNMESEGFQLWFSLRTVRKFTEYLEFKLKKKYLLKFRKLLKIKGS